MVTTGARGFRSFVLVLGRLDGVLDIGLRDTGHLVPEFLDDQFGGILVDGLVLRRHDVHFHERLDDIRDPFGHAVGKLLDRDAFRHDHVTHDLLAFLRAAHHLALFALLTAAHGGQRALTPAIAIVQRLADGQLAGASAAIVTPARWCRFLGRFLACGRTRIRSETATAWTVFLGGRLCRVGSCGGCGRRGRLGGLGGLEGRFLLAALAFFFLGTSPGGRCCSFGSAALGLFFATLGLLGLAHLPGFLVDLVLTDIAASRRAASSLLSPPDWPRPPPPPSRRRD